VSSNTWRTCGLCFVKVKVHRGSRESWIHWWRPTSGCPPQESQLTLDKAPHLEKVSKDIFGYYMFAWLPDFDISHVKLRCLTDLMGVLSGAMRWLHETFGVLFTRFLPELPVSTARLLSRYSLMALRFVDMSYSTSGIFDPVPVSDLPATRPRKAYSSSTFRWGTS
jgi:hypothetical protein